MFKKFREKKKIYEEDCDILQQKYSFFRESEHKFKKTLILIEDKVFLIEATTSEEFNKKYNDFILKVKESVPEDCDIQLNYIRIKNKGEIQFINNKYTMIIKYEEFQLKKEYSEEEYLKIKEEYKKNYKEYKEFENILCEKYGVYMGDKVR